MTQHAKDVWYAIGVVCALAAIGYFLYFMVSGITAATPEPQTLEERLWEAEHGSVFDVCDFDGYGPAC